MFSKFFSIFKKPKTAEEVILQNAIDNTQPKLNVDNIKIVRAEKEVVEEDISEEECSYTFDFTKEKFQKILINKESSLWYSAMLDILCEYDINTPERVAGFLAQTCHECLDYSVMQENLNYSTNGLRKTFPKYFGSVSEAAKYAKKPEMIANKVYANRMGNGPASSGDGWKYRGRGPIQCTGKSNYIACSKFLFGDLRLVEDPDLIIKDKRIAIMSACWYWSVNKLNKYCDKQDVVGMTKKINGGTNGIADRRVRFNKYLGILI